MRNIDLVPTLADLLGRRVPTGGTTGAPLRAVTGGARGGSIVTRDFSKVIRSACPRCQRRAANRAPGAVFLTGAQSDRALRLPWAALYRVGSIPS